MQNTTTQTIQQIAMVLENAQEPLETREERQRYLRSCFGAGNTYIQSVYTRHEKDVDLHREQIRSQPAPTLTERQLSEFVLDRSVPSEWITQRSDEANSYMKHLVALSFLMEDRHMVERQQFLNAQLQRQDKNIQSAAELSKYWLGAISAGDSASLLRATAPNAYAETIRFIQTQPIDDDLAAAKLAATKLTPGMRDELKLQRAFANRIDPVGGVSQWRNSLSEMKDHYLRGLGDKRVSLALSSALLGVSVVAGTGPAGLVIGGMKLANGLLSTPAGQAFQSKLFNGGRNFLTTLGVEREVIDSVSQSVSQAVETALSSKWTKRAILGITAGAVVFGSFESLVDGPSTAALSDLTQIAPQDIPQVFHQVSPGDTLSKIAKAHIEATSGIAAAPEDIKQWVKIIQIENNIADPNRIFAGQTLSIPTQAPDIVPSSIPPEHLMHSELATAKTIISRSPGM